MWGTRSSVAGTGSRSFDLPTRNRESPAPNEQEIKPTESISIFSVHFTLNLPQASRLLGMTKERAAFYVKWFLDRRRLHQLRFSHGFPLNHTPLLCHPEQPTR